MPILKANDILNKDSAMKLGQAVREKLEETITKAEDTVTINKTIQLEQLDDSMHSPQVDSAIFNTLRILKQIAPSDTYLEAYKWHYAKQKDAFMDTYHFMWYLGAIVKPKRILEIGTRTGLSIAQLLSATLDYDRIECIYLCDLFNDGLSTPELVIKNLNHLNIPTDKINFIVGDSLAEVPALMIAYPDLKFDYILVDGCHDKDYARKDLENAVKLIDKGGYIVFDDITPDGCALQDVWDEFKQNNLKDFIFGENHDGKGIGYARKTIQ